MSALRQTNTRESIREEDVEAPKDRGDSSKAATAFAAAPGRGHNPVFLLKVILRKILFSAEEENLTRSGQIILLLRDVILGIIFGLLTLSTLLFLDHRDVVHFQSAHNFRDAAFELLNDPETIANIEESSDLKFMSFDDYESKRQEIVGVEDKLRSQKELLEKRIKEGEEKDKDSDAVREEYETLMKNPLLGLDKYCGSCKWQGRTSCDQRVKYLRDTYNIGEPVAKIGAMNAPSCVTQV